MPHKRWNRFSATRSGMDDKHGVLRIVHPTQHVLEFKTFELLIQLFQIIGDFLGESLLVGFFRNLYERTRILGKRMQLVP